jgi:hypothetical protein
MPEHPGGTKDRKTPEQIEFSRIIDLDGLGSRRAASFEASIPWLRKCVVAIAVTYDGKQLASSAGSVGGECLYRPVDEAIRQAKEISAYYGFLGHGPADIVVRSTILDVPRLHTAGNPLAIDGDELSQSHGEIPPDWSTLSAEDLARWDKTGGDAMPIPPPALGPRILANDAIWKASASDAETLRTIEAHLRTWEWCGVEPKDSR